MNDNLIYNTVYPDLTDTQINESKKVLSKMPNYIKSVNDFAIATAQEMLGSCEGNEIYSPISLYYAMALLTSGADNNTLAELLDVMNSDNVDELNQNAHTMYNALYTDKEKIKCQIANSLWLADKMNFSAEYLNYAKNLYSSLYSVDYLDENTAKLQNKWIEDNTNGTLDVSERSVPKDTILTILNTVYFYSPWFIPFDEVNSSDGVFTLADGGEVDVHYMSKYFMSNAKFVVGDCFIRSSHELDFKDGSKAIFVVPQDGYSVDDLLSSAEKLNESFFGGVEYHGELKYQIPKFKAKSEFDIADTMKNLGVNDAFDNRADFDKMLADSCPIMVSAISQQASFEMDEYGVEAAAFTEIRMVRMSLPMPAEYSCEMILDKPFLYGIEKNGVLMFMGVCNNPNEM